MGNSMKLFGSGFFKRAVKAAPVGAAVMLSAAPGFAQSGPFSGFDGAWAGNGTVALSDGTTEGIRCRADYKIDGTGLNLKQSLRCASDSYKLNDLTSLQARENGFPETGARPVARSSASSRAPPGRRDRGVRR